MGESDVPRADGLSLPEVERLVNLTGHEIVLAAQGVADPCAGSGALQPSVVSVPPEGRFARVDDGWAFLGRGRVNTGLGVVQLTRLRRTSRVCDLPEPQPGTRLVVPRLTALAAQGRQDLVFPFGEVRDGHGQIVSARGLGAFRPGWSAAQRWRDWRTFRREREASRDPGRLALTGVMFATATALLGGALGLWPGVADNIRRNGWGGGGQWWTAWLTVAFSVLGAALLAWAAWRWRKRGMLLDQRGTAYVIEEQAITWRHEEKASVLATIGAGFASVLRVPGPQALGENWHWQTDAVSASRWDARTDQLVNAFWAVHYNDDQVTRNALFIWAPWPVAMAFGARATARRRGLILHVRAGPGACGPVLHVRQRPSYGATGPRQELDLNDAAHDFLRRGAVAPLSEVAAGHAVQHLQVQLTVTFKSLPVSKATALGSPQRRRASGRGQPPPGSHPRILLLVVRITDGPIGGIEMDLLTSADVAVSVPSGLSAALPPGRHPVTVAEWRLQPRSGGHPSQEHPFQLPWAGFPTATELICDWILERAHAHPGHVTLLATRIPQELAVGLGVHLGQGPRRLGEDSQATGRSTPAHRNALTWPDHIYPVYFADGQLVVPELDLGAASVRPERQ
jgi:hypothetical protein